MFNSLGVWPEEAALYDFTSLTLHLYLFTESDNSTWNSMKGIKTAAAYAGYTIKWLPHFSGSHIPIFP